ncbi:ABC transporter ATP-binding protein [Streptomyces sp. NPDC002928]|uniref:ABC transporter ATP-binding protein n=1 Tax=Streptomyces sp. NPDC002928 TaxID=3154440 RepID=UPI0033B196C2
MTGLEAAAGSVPRAQAPVFRVRDLSLELGHGDSRRRILENVDFEVGDGEIVGIIGPSGTGKTSLLRVLGGLTPATSGTVEFDGEPVTGPSRHAITVFQDYAAALLPWRTVERNVALPIESRQPKARRREAVNRALDLVGLRDRGRDYPWRLSGGMQQRVQIARALVVSPRVLLLDEPFGALDAITKASLQDQVLTLHAETKATIVFVTHDLEEAAYLADRVLVLHGTPAGIVEDLRTEVPRPRDQLETRTLPRYREVRDRLGRLLRDGRHD